MGKNIDTGVEPLYKIKRRRVWEIDFLRGFCILLMVFDHAMFDFASLPYWAWNFYRIDNPFFKFMASFADYYWSADWRIAGRIVVVCIFLLLSGISCSFSKNNGVRAAKLSAAAIVLSLATILVDAFADLGVTIIFGILHCLAMSVILYALVRALIGRGQYAKYCYLGIGIVLVIGGVLIDYYYIPEIPHLPETFRELFSLILGTAYYGADAFGLLPYTGVFFIGAFAGEHLYAAKKSRLPLLDGAWNKPLCFVGRNTIWVYLVHQPVILGIIALIAMALGYQFF